SPSGEHSSSVGQGSDKPPVAQRDWPSNCSLGGVLVGPVPNSRRLAMQVELYGPHCSCRFAACPDTPAAQVLDRMTEDGPWYALGDGETFEDMIFTTLISEGAIRCPECG